MRTPHIALALAALAVAPAAQCSLTKLLASDLAAGDRFGSGVSIDGDVAIVGSPYDETGDSNSGSAYVFRRVGGAWVEAQKLVASDAAYHSSFGHALAVDGGRAVVGAFVEDSVAYGAGAAYVLEEVGGVWVETAKLTAFDGGPMQSFGEGVALTANVAFVGAKKRDGAVGSDSGAVYRFDEAGCPTLFGSPHAISLATGGVQSMQLDLGPAHAGATYLVLGSASGTAPHIFLDGVEVPLSFDLLTWYTLANPNAAPYAGTLGALDAAGFGGANVSLPPGALPGQVGVTVHHAAVVLSPSGALVAATNAIALQLAP